jgi:hypothetical protein
MIITNGLAGTGTSTARRSLESILEQVGPVGMGRAWEEIGLGVVVGPLILVGDRQSDWCAQCVSKLSARQDRHSVLLIALFDMPFIREKKLEEVDKFGKITISLGTLRSVARR